MATVEAISPDLYAEEKYKLGKFTCDICLMQWPMTHQRLMRGGLRVGVVCCFEADGDETERDLRRAAATLLAARRNAEMMQPPKAPDGVPYAGQNDLIDTDAAIISIAPSPAILVKGGAPVSIVLTGVNFTATDSIVYGSAGLTNSVSPSLSGTDQWTLSVAAAGGMTAGQYSLTFGPLASVWQKVFDVR